MHNASATATLMLAFAAWPLRSLLIEKPPCKYVMHCKVKRDIPAAAASIGFFNHAGMRAWNVAAEV